MFMPQYVGAESAGGGEYKVGQSVMREQIFDSRPEHAQATYVIRT